jgi:hypothetical protein
MHKLLWLFFLIASGQLFAQETYSFSGEVIDSMNRPVAVGDVLLLDIDDKSIIDYTSILDGRFSFPDVNKGKFLIKVTCLGYMELEQVLELSRNTSLNIQLKESPTNLSEVEVRAAKPVFTLKDGNIVVAMDNPILSSVSDPMELLSKLPNIQLSTDRETLTIIGKGAPLIYDGNLRISLEEFAALSVNDIQTIEIITNPSAKYEAAGRAVVLITRKLNRSSEGVRGSLSETLSFRRNVNNYLNANASINDNKWTLKTNIDYNALLQWESHSFEFAIPGQDILSDYTVLVDRNDRMQIHAGGGLSYQINETDYFSLNSTISQRSDDFLIDTNTFLRQGSSEDYIVTQTSNDNSQDFISSNLNYNKHFPSGIKLFTGLQYTTFTQKLNTEVFNNSNDDGFERDQERKQKYRIRVAAFRVDMEKTIKDGWKLELGTNINYARANAFSRINVFNPLDTTDVNYDYTEKTYAAYAQFSGKILKKITFNTGFRIEDNEVRGDLESDMLPLVNQKNTNLFPRAKLNMEIDSSKSLTFNYGRNINRPNYSRASSISVFINPFLEGAGNVNLRPTTIEEVSTNFQFGNNFLYVGYSWSKNPMYFTIDYDNIQETAVLSLRNLNKEAGWNVSLTIPKTKGIWTSTNTISLQTKEIKDSTATTESARPYLYFYTNHQFLIARDTTVSIGGWGLTKYSEGIFKRNGLLVMEAAVSKTFFDKFVCSFRLNDISRAIRSEESYSINGVNTRGIYYGDAHEVALSVKYNFGSLKEPNYKNKDIDENLDRIR